MVKVRIQIKNEQLQQS